MFIIAGVAVATFLIGAVGTYYLTGRSGGGNNMDGGNENRINTQGAINNVIVKDIQDSVDIENSEIVIILYIICVLNIVEFLYFLYRQHLKNMKKRYSTSQTV